MSMPGFVFHFRCKCGALSDEYPAYAFPLTFDANLTLPTWSTQHKFWGTLNAVLTDADRIELDGDYERLQEFAASISTDHMTVGAQRLASGGVEIQPTPCCPQCGDICETVFGHTPNSGKPSISAEMLKDFDTIPIALADLSVRARMICNEIGLTTLGDLGEFNDRIVNHPRITQNVILEIDNILALKPLPEA
jgi:hypothetical protein